MNEINRNGDKLKQMTNKEIFIQEIEELLADRCKTFGTDGLSEGARAYLEQLKATPEKEKAPFTESGARVLIWMQEHADEYNNILRAKEIAEGMFAINGTPITSRTVSGAMRKLITDGYVEKIAGTPVCYSLTDSGRSVDVILPEPKQDKKSKED
jgi:DNA-binding MarR family transcriptional regulator